MACTTRGPSAYILPYEMWEKRPGSCLAALAECVKERFKRLQFLGRVPAHWTLETVDKSVCVDVDGTPARGDARATKTVVPTLLVRIGGLLLADVVPCDCGGGGAGGGLHLSTSARAALDAVGTVVKAYQTVTRRGGEIDAASYAALFSVDGVCPLYSGIETCAPPRATAAHPRRLVVDTPSPRLVRGARAATERINAEARAVALRDQRRRRAAALAAARAAAAAGAPIPPAASRFLRRLYFHDHPTAA